MRAALDEQVARSASGRWRAAIPTSGWTPRSSGSASRGGVRQKALVIAYGVHESGRREVIGLDVGEAETEALLARLPTRPRRPRPDRRAACVSDAHQGLKHAIGKVLGVPWQRCTVHFLRDMLGHVQRRAQQQMVGAAIHQVFAAPTREEARAILADVVARLERVAPKVARLLEDAEGDLLAFLRLPAEHRSKLRSTNPLERVNREIGRRSDVDRHLPQRRRPDPPRRPRCSSSKTTNGSSSAATSPRSRSTRLYANDALSVRPPDDIIKMRKNTRWQTLAPA